MISGKKVSLRAIEREDLKTLLAWRNKPEFRRYFREHRELNWEQQLSWYENIVLLDNNVRMFAIDQENKLIGACGLCYINWVDRNADLSIYIGINDIYIDDLLAIDASKILINYAFDELNLHRLWTEIYDFDLYKVRMFEALGFNLDGRHRETHWTNGQWHDSLFFSLLNEKKA